MIFKPVIIRSPAARFALFSLAVFWAVAGWWILLHGELTLSLDKRSLHPVPLEGGAALFMAFIFLLLSTTAAAVLLHSRQTGRGGFWFLIFANIVLPIVYLIVG